jgi:hypothetical protein
LTTVRFSARRVIGSSCAAIWMDLSSGDPVTSLTSADADYDKL